MVGSLLNLHVHNTPPSNIPEFLLITEICIQFCFKKQDLAGAMTQQLQELVALPEDTGWIPSNHMVSLNCLQLQFQVVRHPPLASVGLQAHSPARMAVIRKKIIINAGEDLWTADVNINFPGSMDISLEAPHKNES